LSAALEAYTFLRSSLLLPASKFKGSINSMNSHYL
jgi:hypothetical protein